MTGISKLLNDDRFLKVAGIAILLAIVGKRATEGIPGNGALFLRQLCEGITEAGGALGIYAATGRAKCSKG